jgi:hypothetical protein
MFPISLGCFNLSKNHNELPKAAQLAKKLPRIARSLNNKINE